MNSLLASEEKGLLIDEEFDTDIDALDTETLYFHINPQPQNIIF